MPRTRTRGGRQTNAQGQGRKMKNKNRGKARGKPYNVERRSREAHVDISSDECSAHDSGAHHYRDNSRVSDGHYRSSQPVDRNGDWVARLEEHLRDDSSPPAGGRERRRSGSVDIIYRRGRSRSRSSTSRSSRGSSRLTDGVQGARQMYGEDTAERRSYSPRFESEDDGAHDVPRRDDVHRRVDKAYDVRHFAENDCNEFSWLNRETKYVPDDQQLRTSCEGEKNNLAAIILSCICLAFNGNVKLKPLMEALSEKLVINFKSSGALKNFLNAYPWVFSFHVDEVKDGKVGESSVKEMEVTAKPSIKLCIEHSTKAGSCPGKCGSFHICKYYFLSKCDVSSSGKRCLFGHDMETEHNKKVMRDSLLHKFPVKSQGVLLQFDYRNSTTVPVICRFYNNPKGCRNGRCKFLHICSKYILGNCTEQICRRSHNIMMDQPFHILRSYGLVDPENRYTENHVLNLLRSTSNEQGTFQINKQTRGCAHVVRPGSSWVQMSDSTSEEEDDDIDGDWQWERETSRDTWEDLRNSDHLESAYREYIQANRPRLFIDNRSIRAHFTKMRMEVIGGTRCRIRRVKRA